MRKKRNKSKENLELAEEHITLAESLVLEEAKNHKGEKQKSLGKAAFNLEQAEADLEDVK
ncbi:hypothetical protein J4429_00420 [Candidatus Pacearchaeota archaeon]|nr:hypothetical protein [uncultured archaeon]MBS3074901.1 hypothetical protein [Candidatus Pacearchaeota archaeon]AQS32572.1 hypothetical protein [uncultured archaeon]AQS33058.1 hypothetical protein [uncultured archaeon]AQS34689.1 hypothetical protein [uncultured archaeon]